MYPVSEREHYGAAEAPLGFPSSTRRNNRRVPLRTPCRVRVFGGGDHPGAAMYGNAVNLSDHGLAIQVGHAVEPGHRVEVLLPHLDGEPTCLYGDVVHTRRVVTGTYEIGIRLRLD